MKLATKHVAPVPDMCLLCPGIRRARQPNVATGTGQYTKHGRQHSTEFPICDWCAEHQSHPENRARNWDLKVRKL